MSTKALNKRKVLKILKPFISKGLSIRKACQFMGIDPSTVYHWCDNDPTLSVKIESWRHELSKIALTNIEDALINGLKTRYGIDKYTPSVQYLEKIEKDEFGKEALVQNNLNLTVVDNKPLSERIKELASKSGMTIDIAKPSLLKD